MFCKKCGSQIENGAVFCKKCGAPAERISSSDHSSMAVYLKIGIIIACLLTMVSTMLPFYKFNSFIAGFVGVDSISWLKTGDQIGVGAIMIVLAAMIILFTCLNKRPAVMITGIFTFVCYWGYMFFLMFQFRRIEKEAGGYIKISDVISKGPGYYLMFVAIMVLFVLSVLYVRQKGKTR